MKRRCIFASGHIALFIVSNLGPTLVLVFLKGSLTFQCHFHSLLQLSFAASLNYLLEALRSGQSIVCSVSTQLSLYHLQYGKVDVRWQYNTFWIELSQYCPSRVSFGGGEPREKILPTIPVLVAQCPCVTSIIYWIYYHVILHVKQDMFFFFTLK